MLKLIKDFDTSGRELQEFSQACQSLKDRLDKLARASTEKGLDDYAEAYGSLYLQVIEIEGEAMFAGDWLKSKDHKKFSVFTDKLLMLNKSLENAQFQSADFSPNLSTENKVEMCGFRRAA